MPAMWVRMLAVSVIFAAGCATDDLGIATTDGSPPADDAGVGIADAAPHDGSVPLSWVDFAISGCGDHAHASEPPCIGVAPLTLRFVALAPASIDVYRWSFGDDTGHFTETSPAHTFALPGSYDVSLVVGGPGGTARAAVPGAVQVEPAAIGASCDLGLQCETGSCVCGDGACAAPLADGLCAAPCDSESPCELGVCADLAAAAPDEPAPWQQSLCVRACDTDSDCPAGRACMDLPAGASSVEAASDRDNWVRGCFARELLAPIGGSCLGATGEPVHNACASGLCVAEGARGMCAAGCENAADCPQSAACAEFDDGGGLGSLCVHRCGNGDPCEDDPWLACEPDGGSGELGFTVDEDPAEAGYCAPKRCFPPPAEDVCGPDGACIDGFCGPA